MVSLPVVIPDAEIAAIRFFAVCCVHLIPFVAKRYILHQKYLKKWIGSELLGTQRYHFQPHTPTLSVTVHSVTDRQTDTDRRQYHAKSRSYSVQQYDRLKRSTICFNDNFSAFQICHMFQKCLKDCSTLFFVPVQLQKLAFMFSVQSKAISV